MKRECIRPAAPASLEEARRRVADCVEHYNHVRLHSAIGYLTPADKLNGLDQVIFAERDPKLEAARQRRQQARQRAPQYLAEAAVTGTNLAAVQLKARSHSAQASIAKAVAHAQQAWRSDRTNPQLTYVLELSYVGLAQIAIQNHDHAALAALGESHVALAPQSGADAWIAARLIALASGQASLDVNLNGEEQAAAADKYARRAIELLREAVASGYITESARLHGEGDLQALRERHEFQSLLRETGEPQLD